MDADSNALSPTDGFTLTELMTVLAIVAILVAVAGVSYSRFTAKAKSVEAEVALSEIHRLEQIHYASTGTYTSSVEELGFNPFPPLKYYSVSVQVAGESGDSAFRALAVPLSGSGGQTFSVVQYAPTKVSGASGGSGGPSVPGGSTGLAFGGEGWSDEGIIRLDTTGGSKGGIEKIVSHQKSSGVSLESKK
jgi:prepilin-type N-terminal cleavage/methylation domain-containing protein